MILNNVRVALTNDVVNVKVKDGKIAQISHNPLRDTAGTFRLTFENAIIFPGLINSHDHLDFNLFPSLGNKKYKNYTEWGRYIHKHYKDKINKVLDVPVVLREQWGIYKNLLCGVTTVVNHGEKIKRKTDLLSAYEECQSIHSVKFEKKWKIALNNPLKKKLQAVIHTGEGTDPAANSEIDELIKWNLLSKALIGVHGVAMTADQAKAFKALVWCPESNYFLLDCTAQVDLLKKHLTILFGTDSTLTGNWDIWHHIRRAHDTELLTDRELYDALTTNAAQTWDLNSGEIAEGKDADMVIAKTKETEAGADAFFSVEPQDIQLILHKGNIALFDEELFTQLKGINMENYGRVYVGGACKYVLGDLPQLMQKIRKYYPEVSFPVI